MKIDLLKFGGSSVRYGINEIINILNQSNNKKIVVLSAFYDITNYLCEISKSILYNKKIILYDNIKNIHLNICDENNLSFDDKNEIKKILLQLKDDIDNNKKENIIISYGEILSTEIISKILFKNDVKNIVIDFKKLIIKNENGVDYDNTKVNINNNLIPFLNDYDTVIVPGFICTNENEEIDSLGRGGSDYTATILARLIDEINYVDIYTDVNGILTGDPRKIDDTKNIPEINISEIKELSYFGAKIIYSLSLIPLFNSNKDIFIKNTFDSKGDYTRITNSQTFDNNTLLTSITSLNNHILICIYGAGMIGKVGFLCKILNILAELQINIPFITQASSEQSISICVSENHLQDIKNSFDILLKNELEKKYIENIKYKDNISIITVVGNGMINKPGTVGKLFSDLGNNDINILSISQGSTENSVSFIIDNEMEIKTLNLLHKYCIK